MASSECASGRRPTTNALPRSIPWAELQTSYAIHRPFSRGDLLLLYSSATGLSTRRKSASAANGSSDLHPFRARCCPPHHCSCCCCHGSAGGPFLLLRGPDAPPEHYWRATIIQKRVEAICSFRWSAVVPEAAGACLTELSRSFARWAGHAPAVSADRPLMHRRMGSLLLHRSLQSVCAGVGLGGSGSCTLSFVPQKGKGGNLVKVVLNVVRLLLMSEVKRRRAAASTLSKVLAVHHRTETDHPVRYLAWPPAAASAGRGYAGQGGCHPRPQGPTK